MPTWDTIIAARLSDGRYYLYVSSSILSSPTSVPLIATNGQFCIGANEVPLYHENGGLQFGLIQMWLNYELNYTNFTTLCANFHYNIVSTRWPSYT